MDIEKLKDVLGDDVHAELIQHVNELTAQRDAARKESIQHRTGLKSKVQELEAKNHELTRAQEEMLERLGVDSIDQLKELDPKGQADAVRQYEAKLKRLESQLNEKTAAYDALNNNYRQSKLSAALRKAMAEHEWIDQDIVESFVNKHLVYEDDQVLYRATDNVVIPLNEGMQILAKEKPHLLKTTASGGSGYRGASNNGSTALTGNPFAKETFNLTQQIELNRTDPNKAAQLKIAAGLNS